MLAYEFKQEQLYNTLLTYFLNKSMADRYDLQTEEGCLLLHPVHPKFKTLLSKQ